MELTKQTLDNLQQLRATIAGDKTPIYVGITHDLNETDACIGDCERMLALGVPDTEAFLCEVIQHRMAPVKARVDLWRRFEKRRKARS